jgi:hypothetical protein
MELEVQEYPEYWNAYDSLVEIYAFLGDKQPAIRNSGMSLELKPGNRNAIERLKMLKEQE